MTAGAKGDKAAPSRTSPMKEPAYRAWFFSQILSSAGLQTQNVATAWIVYVQTHSGIVLAFLAVATLGPGFLLSVWAGSILDRVSRRTVLLLTQSASLLVSVALGVVSLGGHPALVAVFGLSIVSGVINAFDGPGRQIIVIDLVGRGGLGGAVTLYEVSLSVARTLGPALGGLLLGAAGASACFFFNAATFVAPIVVLAVFRPRHEVHRTPQGARRTGAFHGLRYALTSPTIRSCLLIAVLIGTVVNTASYYPLFASQSLHLDSAGYGTLVACLGLGSLPGALLAARLGEHDRGRRVAIAAIATGIAALLTGFARFPLWAFAGVVLIGLTSIFVISVANTLTQLVVPDALRGRVMGAWTMAIPGMNPLTGLAIGAIADGLGPRDVFWTIGVAFIVVAAVCWRSLTAASRSAADGTAPA